MCLVVGLGLFMPRFVLFLLWAFTSYLDRAFHSFVWPLIGFFLLPTTTLGYAIAKVSFHGLKGAGLIFVIGGLLFDLGVFGGGRGIMNNRPIGRPSRWGRSM